MTHLSKSLLVSTLYVGGLWATASVAEPTQTISAADGLLQIKALAGDWIGTFGDEMGLVSYEITANGSAVTEEMSGMTTIYHQNGDALMATHYCSMGNQPRMLATGDAINRESIAFDFLDITNLKPGSGHINSVKLMPVGQNELIQEWTDRSPSGVGEPFQFRFTRVQPHQIALQYQKPQQIVGVQKTTTLAELNETLRLALRSVQAFAAAKNLAVTDFPVARYDQFSDTRVVVTIGLPFEGEAVNDGEFSTSELTPGPVATTMHRGTNETSELAYAKLHQWMEQNLRSPNGAPWEILITDLETVQPHRQITKIIYPISNRL